MQSISDKDTKSKSESWVRLTRQPTLRGPVAQDAPDQEIKDSKRGGISPPGGPFVPPVSKGAMTVRHNGLQTRGSRVVRLPALPPMLLTSPTFDQVLRFTASVNSVVGITVGELATACGVVAATAILAFPWSSAIRVRAIHVWPASVAVGGSSACQLSWRSASSAGYQPEEAKDETLPAGISVTRPGKFGPPKGSLANDWLSSTLASEALFNLQAPQGSIVDVHVLCRMSNTIAPFPSTVTVGATPGLSYWGSLAGAGVYPPLGRPTVSGL